jgi:sulfur relay (sulfurtransferase) DsrC/TusE family protein
MNEQQIILQDKDQFIQNIKKWVLLDSQLKIVNEKTKKMREMKHDITKQIYEYYNNHKINNKIIISDGELRMTEKKEYSPLTFTYIEECLQKIISEQEQVDFIIKYLKENRQITSVPDIRRTFSN